MRWESWRTESNRSPAREFIRMPSAAVLRTGCQGQGQGRAQPGGYSVIRARNDGGFPDRLGRDTGEYQESR